MKAKRGKARSVALAIAALAAAGTFAVLGAGTSFAGGGLPTGASVTGTARGNTADEAVSAAKRDADSQCVGVASNEDNGGRGTYTENRDGTYVGTWTGSCVDAS